MTSRGLVLARLMVLATRLNYLLLTVMWSVAAFGQEPGSESTAVPVPPLSAPVERSADELEKLAAPIALYPDPLIAVMLPAAVYPVEVIRAARFVANPNNLAAIDDQPWDDNVKAVARFPEVIQYMSDNLDWTVELGEAFMDQPLELSDAIQALRAKAQSAGTLQTTPEQIVTVTNAVVERTYQTQIVYVTNTIVQIVPADPQVIYVPIYNPAVVFAPPLTYVRVAPLITFRPGIRAGPIIVSRRVNWWYGGVYYGPGGFVYWGGRPFGRYVYFPPPPGFRPPPFRPRPGWRPPRPGYRPPGLPPPGPVRPGRPTALPARWRPDPIRRGGGRPRAIASAPTTEDRGWGNRPGPSPGGSGTRPDSNVGGNRPSPSPGNSQPGPRPSPGGGGTRPDSNVGGNRPSTGAVGNRPDVPSTPSVNQPATRPSPSPDNTRPGPGGSRPGAGGSARPSPGPAPSSGSGLDDMNNGGQSRDFSRRGESSRQNSSGSRGNSSGPRGDRGGNRQ